MDLELMFKLEASSDITCWSCLLNHQVKGYMAHGIDDDFRVHLTILCPNLLNMRIIH